MQAIKKLRDLIGENPTHYIPSTMEFLALDLDHLADKLGIRKKAAERGTKEQPDSNSEHLDSVETEIVHKIEEEKNRDYSTLLSQLNTYDVRLSASSIIGNIFEIKSAARNAISEFEAEVRDGENQLIRDQQAVKEINNERISFRRENGLLSRTAAHPDSPIFVYGFLFFLFALETLLNGNFFAVGLDSGLIGGIIEATLIAGVNVVLGFLIGKAFFPQIFHIRKSRQIVGWLAIFVYLTLSVLFNLCVAHYRLALGGEHPENAAIIAIDTFYKNPINLPDFNSYLLTAMGLLFSIFASIDGFKLNDRYPGYSALQRRYDSILQSYADHLQEIVDRLKGIKDREIHNIIEVKERLSGRQSERDDILSNRQRLITAFDQRISYLQNCVTNLLCIYRLESRPLLPILISPIICSTQVKLAIHCIPWIEWK